MHIHMLIYINIYTQGLTHMHRHITHSSLDLWTFTMATFAFYLVYIRLVRSNKRSTHTYFAYFLIHVNTEFVWLPARTYICTKLTH